MKTKEVTVRFQAAGVNKYEQLRTLLVPFHIETIYADGNYAYEKYMSDTSKVVTGKRNTQRIERPSFSSYLVQQAG